MPIQIRRPNREHRGESRGPERTSQIWKYKPIGLKRFDNDNAQITTDVLKTKTKDFKVVNTKCQNPPQNKHPTYQQFANQDGLIYLNV